MDHFDTSHRATDEIKEVNDWIRFGLRIGLSSLLHPFEYSKVLIQLGYEPIPPRMGTSLLGHPTMMLPNIFQYTGHIRKVDGFKGCFRGLSPKLLGTIFSTVVTEKVSDALGLKPYEKEKDDGVLSDEELYIQYKTNLKRDIVLSITGICVSQPFHVISVRMMAQFVGRETIYNSVWLSAKEIYQHEGVLGFFSGIVPKLLGDLAVLILGSTTIYIVNKYVIKDKVGRQYNAGFTQFAISSLLYPLQVVATCMCVTGSRLMAASPPAMPIYGNWLDCWNDLQNRGELKRGNSVFWRSIPSSSLHTKMGQNRKQYAPLPLLSKY